MVRYSIIEDNMSQIYSDTNKKIIRKRSLNNIISIKVTSQFLDMLDKYNNKFLTPTEKIENQYPTYGNQIKRMLATMLTELETKVKD